MATLIQNRNFRLGFSASAISNLGDGVSALAFPWLASLITRDPALIAWVAFATSLPWLLFAIPAGVITDRKDRKTLMVGADMFRMILTMGVIALILNIGSFPPADGAGFYIAALAGLAFLLGSAEVIRDNSAQTLLPSIVEGPQLERANGHLWSIEQIMGSFIGPPIAGFLIAWAVPAPFLLDAVTFGMAAWLVWAMMLPKRQPGPRRSVFTEAEEGAVWLLGHRAVLQFAVMLGFINMFSTMLLTLLVLYSQDVLGLSAAGHGTLLAFAAAGGVTGGLICPWIAKRLGTRHAVLTALAIMPLPPLVLGLTGSVVITAIVLFVEMFSALLWNVVTVSYRQRAIPDELLGRVNSIYRFFGWGMMPIGALLAGQLSSALEPVLGREDALQTVFLLASGGTTCVLVYGLLRLKI